MWFADACTELNTYLFFTLFVWYFDSPLIAEGVNVWLFLFPKG